jgi:hypothetical protein
MTLQHVSDLPVALPKNLGEKPTLKGFLLLFLRSG